MLVELQGEVASRARAIAESVADWPCRRGCDHCCRHLAEPPRLTRAEWQLVEQGLGMLPQSVQDAVSSRIRTTDSRVCPFLDPDAHACLIYQHRPIACRTYGFYVERDRGLYCHLIQARVESGELEQVVWGNVSAVEARLAEMGEKILLADWFSGSPGLSTQPLPIRPSTHPDLCGATSADR